MKYEHSFKTEDQQLMDMQTKLWDLISTFPDPDDRLRLAGVTLKITIQLYQAALSQEAIEGVLLYAAEHLDNVEPIISQQRIVH